VGSLMRLAAVPIFYHDDIKQACLNSRLSSLVTHQGEEAAECCRLMAFVIVKAIKQGNGDKSFLSKLTQEFMSTEESVNCLAASRQQNSDVDRDWNWQKQNFRYSPKRSKEQPGYIGSYAMDALAMALHCVWTTDNFADCLIKAVNLCGDADSLGSVAGQIAGALYGCSSIPQEWIAAVQQWDRDGDIATRAYKLYNKHTIKFSSTESKEDSVVTSSTASMKPNKRRNRKNKKHKQKQHKDSAKTATPLVTTTSSPSQDSVGLSDEAKQRHDDQDDAEPGDYVLLADEDTGVPVSALNVSSALSFISVVGGT